MNSLINTYSATPSGKTSGRRVLVVSNENVDQGDLLDYISGAAGRRGDTVHVIAPALNSRVNHWMSDLDSAWRKAEDRLRRCLSALQHRGVAATGHVGDSDPIQAIADAFAVIQPDELIIATHPEHRSNWLARGMVDGARERFDVPVTHFIVDADRQSQQLVPAIAA